MSDALHKEIRRLRDELTEAKERIETSMFERDVKQKRYATRASALHDANTKLAAARKQHAADVETIAELDLQLASVRGPLAYAKVAADKGDLEAVRKHVGDAIQAAEESNACECGGGALPCAPPCPAAEESEVEDG